MIDGLLVIDKPAGITSHDVVARARRVLGTRKVGHAGTLDPAATGILVIGVGRATRLLRFCEATEKEYVAKVRFGSRTSTLDATGDVTDSKPADSVDESQLRSVIPRFVGEIDQVPPMVSAIKIDGERLHAKARRGEEVERPPRRVRIDSIEIEDFVAGENPVAKIRVVCGPGTYIRSLADDLGTSCGTFAYLASLRRTRVGTHDESAAVALEELSLEDLQPLEAAVASLPSKQVDAHVEEALRHGKRIEALGQPGFWAAIGPEGLVAVCADVGAEAKVEVGVPPK